MTAEARKHKRPRMRKLPHSVVRVQHDDGMNDLSALPLVAPPPANFNGDMNGDGQVNQADLLDCIAHWGETTDVRWLHAIIAKWGAVPTTPPNQQQSDPIHLSNGATTVANKSITGTTGIVGDNATSVTTLFLSNVTIHSTNYGVYLGSCDVANFDKVDITCDPQGGDSYSLRGTIKNLTSKDSKYRSGIKAFRVYGCLGGSSTRDLITGDRLMLGGGYANEWVNPGPFENFTFRDGAVDVNSAEIYNATNHVTFDGTDWTGTGHISIQFGAHDITIRNSVGAVPTIKYFDGSGNRYYPTTAQLAERGISITG